MPTPKLAEIGDEIVVLEDFNAEDNHLRKGQHYRVDEYVPDPNVNAGEDEGMDPRPYYWLSSNDMGMVWLPAELGQVSRTKADLEARKLPTKSDIAGELAHTIGSWHSISTDESELVGDDAVDFLGQTADGLRFGVHVRVTSVWLADA